MIDGLIVLLAAGAYLFGWVKVAFWIITFLIVNGVVGTARALLDPDWYQAKAAEAGATPNLRRLALSNISKILFLSWVAWRIGLAAGYFA